MTGALAIRASLLMALQPDGGYGEHGVPGDRGVEADLGLVEAEAVLAELEIFLYGPAQPGGADQPGQGEYLAIGPVAVVKRPAHRS